jgi:predicted lipoprotein with Yx(FWY)xxD motif
MIVARSDGRQQWAYRGQPVYMRFHDAPDQPTGDGIDGKWHLIPYTKTQ